MSARPIRAVFASSLAYLFAADVRAPRRHRLAVTALAAVAACAVAPPATARSAPAPAPAEVIVRFAGDATARERAEIRRAADTTVQRALPLTGAQLLEPGDGTTVREAIRELESDPSVLYAEPNHVRRAQAVPTDRFFGLQWGLHNTGQPIRGVAGTPGADISGLAAFELTRGAPSVTVAIVDSGVESAHPDLAPNRWENPGEAGALGANGLDDDGNGFIDDRRGWDFVADSGAAVDPHGHGTHVAGTVAASADDVGVVGVAPQTTFMHVRALGADGSGTVADVISAYGYAARNGARIVNASLGGPEFVQAEFDAIAASPHVLFVVAAGNEGLEPDPAPQYPCNHDLDNVVCVAATDQHDDLAGFSNRGATSVDLGAPGVNIASTYRDGTWKYMSGTSMATPHVAGAAALLLAQTPSATPTAVRAALLRGADPVASHAGDTVSGGRLNARRALEELAAAAAPPAAAPPLPPPPPPAPDAPDPPATQTAAPGGAPAPPAAAAPAPASTAAPPAAAPLAPIAPDPAPVARRSAPAVRVDVARRISLAGLRRSGLRLRLTCSSACRPDAVLTVDRRTARRLGLRPTGTLTRIGTLARRTASVRSATLRARLTPGAARRLARVRSVRATLLVRASDSAGARRTVRVGVTIRR